MAANYEKNLFKHNQQLIVENENLKKDIAKIETETENKYLTIIYKLEEKIDFFMKKCAVLEERVSMLESENIRKDNEIKRLKAIIDKDSSNSSKPPSSGGFKKIPNSRDESDKKPGGQVGHKGTTLTVPKNLDELVAAGKAVKRVVDYTNGAKQYISRWKVDIETRVVYTEYRISKGLPKVCYGENLKALSVLLSNEGFISEGRLSDFFSSITGGLIRVSNASIEKFNHEIAEKVDIEALKEDLLNGETINVDETSMDSAQLLEYGDTQAKTAIKTTFSAIIRTHSNKNTTLYTVNPHKDDFGVQKDGILTNFFGILSHDHDKKYYKYATRHATCGAHLSRELKGLYELYKIEWADKFRKFYTGINDYKNATNECSPTKLTEFEYTYDELLDNGDVILKNMSQKSFGHKEFRPILKRLREYKNSYLLFIKDYKAPFTNNLAERDLRPCKIKLKISGCFRTWKGLVCYAKIRSFLSTAKKRSQDLFDLIKKLFLGENILPAEL